MELFTGEYACDIDCYFSGSPNNMLSVPFKYSLIFRRINISRPHPKLDERFLIGTWFISPR